MNNRAGLRLAVAVVCLMAAAATLAAQDFQKSYRLGAGSRISVRNVSGNVVVTGYDGDQITVTAFKEGRDRDQVQVEDTSDDRHLDIRARYPEHCEHCNASIRFEVKVPRSVSYDYAAISSVSGDVEVSHVTGSLNAKSVSGKVRIESAAGAITAHSVSGEVLVKQASGSVTAKSTSGSVEVEILRLDNTQKMEFASVSGDIDVQLPSDLGAEIEMSTLSGALETQFPITIQEKQYGPGKSARGRVGDGSRSLRLHTVSGGLKLRRM